MADFKVRAGYAERITWSRGSCGNPGCTDAGCGCALCGAPIGISADDPRWDEHGYEDCYDQNCPVCADRVPIILFHGEGEAMVQAAFHLKCFEQAFWMPATAGPIG